MGCGSRPEWAFSISRDTRRREPASNVPRGRRSILELVSEDSWRSVYADKLEVRPPGAPTTGEAGGDLFATGAISSSSNAPLGFARRSDRCSPLSGPCFSTPRERCALSSARIVRRLVRTSPEGRPPQRGSDSRARLDRAERCMPGSTSSRTPVRARSKRAESRHTQDDEVANKARSV